MNDDDDSGLPEQMFSRINDPATSHAAGQGAGEQLADSMKWVTRVMSDGKPRIDEEIFAEAEALGYTKSADRTRHGRDALVDKGILRPTGKTRATTRKRQSQEWEFTGTPVPRDAVMTKQTTPVQASLPFDAPFTPHCASCTCGKHKTDE